MSPLRSLGAIIGGILLLRVMDLMLPSLITHTIASVMAGYVIGRIARAQEMRHAVAAAVVLSAAYLMAVLSDNPALPPMETRIAVLVVTGPALIAGAWIRGRARALQTEAVTKPGDHV